MRKILIILFLFSTIYANARTTYYVSSSGGSDLNSGTSSGSAWASLAKVNSFAFIPGDSILFKRGDTWYGYLTIGRSGTVAAPIVFDAYGIGAIPMVSGLSQVTSWTNIGTNIWESSVAVSASTQMNEVLINGINTPMGRYPNSGYLNITAATGTTSISNSTLNSALTNWTGAEAVVRKVAWITDRNPITNHSGTTLTITSPDTYGGIVGFGFFIQNDPKTLDIQNEWYYSPTTKKIRIYSTSSPTNVYVSTIDTLFRITNKHDININHIYFDGANKYGMQVSAQNIHITNCTIDHSGVYGFWGGANLNTSTGLIFDGNTINHSNNNGFLIRDFFTGALVQNNVVKNTGLQEGMLDRLSNGNQFGIGIEIKANAVTCQYNEVDSSGYCGIEPWNNDDIVQYNLIQWGLLKITDGGLIYTFVGFDASGNPNPPKTGIKILHNICVAAVGNNAGTNNVGLPQAQGIYCDDEAGNIEIAYNTVIDCGDAGLFLHNNPILNVHDNTFYNNGVGIDVFSSKASGPVRNLTFKNNLVISKAATQNVAYFDSRTTDIVSFGTPASIDSNYWARPIDDNIVFKTLQGVTNGTNTLATWKTVYGYDAHSLGSPRVITDTADFKLYINPSPSSLFVTFPYVYIDMRSNTYSGSITIPPYGSAVLLKTGLTNVPPTADANVDQTITLPTNTITFAGGGIDHDGTVVSYAWTQLSGPSIATIPSPTNPNGTATNLIAGTYVFQILVTDNDGGTGTDNMQVTVNPVPADAPPVANAGGDQTITLPLSSVTVDGSGSNDPDGSIVSYNWTQVSGPNTATIVSPTSVSTVVSGLIAGIYVFHLGVVDNDGSPASDNVQITVNAAANIPPVANAGTDQTVTISSTTLNASGSTDSDGSIVSYSWTRISGPNTPTIVSASSVSTSVTGLINGTYVFQVLVTDNNGGTNTDNIQVIVSIPVDASKLIFIRGNIIFDK